MKQRKWTIEGIDGHEAIRMAKLDNEYYIIPVAHVCAYRERTRYFVALKVMDFNTKDTEVYSQRIRRKDKLVMEILEDLGGSRFEICFRLGPQKIFKTETEELLNAMRDVLWYLEEWNEPVCLTYRLIRGWDTKIKIK
ncbi:hypothetical protein [Thermoanaerobacterium thermosaccharolyticum]|uniref:hypothetical protein n=1 Tax=Thermoanaerobacterium thermosaccharolyticum TaxID=1517 RepID=UPI003DA9A25F